jgi:hypothetical protein
MVEHPPAMAAAVVPAVAVFVAVMAVALSAMALGPVVGVREVAVWTAPMMCSHEQDIDRDIS